MRVLMLTWELIPRRRGPAAHVDGLAHALANGGHEVVVFTTVSGGDADQEWIADGGAFVRVLRADTSLPWIPDELHVANAASACHHLVQLAAAIGDWRPDVVHAHNWNVGWAADTLARLFGVPLVTTFHSTTQVHHGGRVPPGEPLTIHAVESWLAYRSDQVITTSQFLVNEVCSGFGTGLRPRPIACPTASTPPGGRPTTESPAPRWCWPGVGCATRRLPGARQGAQRRCADPETECVIAGSGSYLPELQSQVDIEGVSDIVRLVGFVRDERLRDYVHRAGCVTIPSLYEPFGIVALEALAGGAAGGRPHRRTRRADRGHRRRAAIRTGQPRRSCRLHRSHTHRYRSDGVDASSRQGAGAPATRGGRSPGAWRWPGPHRPTPTRRSRPSDLHPPLAARTPAPAAPTAGTRG